MILLKGQSLTPEKKVPLEAMSLIIEERGGTAQITPASMEGISLKSWLKDDTEPGKDIVWRVRSIRNGYNNRTDTLQLEHVISTLKDRILFGEIKTETLAGVKGAKTVTAKKAVQFILSKQEDWTLGEFGFPDSNPYKFDGETLYDAIEKITDSLDGAEWTFDTTVYPFRLNIVKMTDTEESEMRAGRNLITISRNVDQAGMFTRFFPIGKDDLHLDGEGCVTKNTDLYGEKDKVQDDQTLDTKEELKRWAEEQLNKHAEPSVTIEADGLELAKDTGEPMDSFTMNRVCRVPLPEFGTTIKARIVQKNYQDKVRNPQRVKVTMANKKRDVTKIIAEAMKRGGGGSRSAAREKKEDHAWFEDTNNHVAMVAEGIVGVDSKGEPNWWRFSELIADGNGIYGHVQGIQNQMVIAETRLDMNEYAIALEATNREKKDKELQGKITVQANQISLVVTKKNGQYVVDAASIVMGINDEADGGGSYIKLKAKAVDLGNYATVGQLDAAVGNFNKLTSGDTTAAWLKANSMAANSFSVNPAGSFMFRSYAVSWKLLQYTDQNGNSAELYVLGRSAS